MPVVSMAAPPATAIPWPSSEPPTPKGIAGTRQRAQVPTISATSATEWGKATGARAMPAFVVSLLPELHFGDGTTLAQQDTGFGERSLMEGAVGAVHDAVTLAGTACLRQGARSGAGTRGGRRAKMRAPGRHASLGATGGLP